MASLQDLFEQVVDLPEAEQSAFLARIGRENPALKISLEQLLRADRKLAHMTMKPATADIASWAAALTGSTLRPGDLVGPFRILAPLGQGGMGVVYRAERAEGSVTQQVAIKIVRREFLDRPTRARFELERQTLATLDHPYIARLLDADELPDGTPYVVMEFVDGVPITEYCDTARMDVRSRVELFRRVCQAVAHAHRHLIVHRDLKPSNILVGEDGLPKLLDFGIAKPLGGHLGKDWTLETGTAQRFFSPRYAAPEQLRGGSIHVGCDVYALGILLFEVLSGRVPFDLDNLSLGQVEQLVMDVPAPPPSARVLGTDHAARQLRRRIQGDLDGIVLKCLRKAASERYESVLQLDEDLERWLKGMPVLARHGHGWYRFNKFVARNRMAVATGLTSILALAVAAAALWQQNNALRTERDRSQQALAIMQEAFASADPIRAAGAEISARQILDSAEKRLDLIAPEQHELLVTLAESIGQVNLSLGRADIAAALFARAEAAAARGAMSPQDRVRLLVSESRALINDDQMDAAEKALQRARQIQLDPGPEWQAMQGKLLAMNGDSKNGLANLRAALAALSHRGPDDEFATTVRFALADALAMAGDVKESLATYDDTLSWQTRELSADHPQIVRTRVRKIAALRRAGQVNQSLVEAEAIVADVVRIYGSETAEAAYAYNLLGRSLEESGQADAALAAYEQSLKASIQSRGLDHLNTNRAQFNLAYALQVRGGRDADAERMYRAAVDNTTRRLGQNSPSSVYFRLYFAAFLADRGRSSEAMALLTPAGGLQGVLQLEPANLETYLSTLTELPDYKHCLRDVSSSASCPRGLAYAKAISDALKP